MLIKLWRIRIVKVFCLSVESLFPSVCLSFCLCVLLSTVCPAILCLSLLSLRPLSVLPVLSCVQALSGSCLLNCSTFFKQTRCDSAFSWSRGSYKTLGCYLLPFFCRNQIEVDLRENHPFFDTPLFLVGRESKLRKVCAMIVNAKYNYVLRDPITGKEIKSKYKQFQWVEEFVA